MSELQATLRALRAQATRGVLDTGRYRLRYFSCGSGPPILFIHGMADAGEAFAMVMHRLFDRFACLAYELPDGKSDGSKLARYSLENYTADFFALLDHLKFDRVAVVGSSYGSLIALAALVAAPARLTHCVLQNGFACRPLNRFQRVLAKLARHWPGRFADWPELHSRVMHRIERHTIAAVPADVAGLFVHHGAQTPIAACASRALTIDRTDLRGLLPSIRTPTLLLTGDSDRLVPRACWDDLERGLPNANRVELTGCGHYPQYTHPGPMAQAIGRFIG